MVAGLDLYSLIKRGGVFTGVEAESSKDVYSFICKNAELPCDVDRDNIFRELCLREEILSTAVGNGIAIPHPRRPLLKSAEDQRIIVCFLKNSLDMSAPDSRRVSVMFILLTSSPKDHVSILSQLAKLFREPGFKEVLEAGPDKEKLLEAVERAGFFRNVKEIS